MLIRHRGPQSSRMKRTIIMEKNKNMRQEERFLDIAVLMGVFFALLFLGVPIAYSLCLSAVLYMALFMDVPMIIIGQQMLKGVDLH